MSEPCVLAADIGGTRTRLGLFDSASGAANPRLECEVATSDADGVAAMLRDFVGTQAIARACVAVAGAVLDERAAGSNLPWPVDAGEIARSLGVAVRLINDLEATAIWIAARGQADGVGLLPGERVVGGPIGIIAPGTGMGQAMLVWLNGRYWPLASEAGHIDFAPADDLQVAWWRFLHQRHGHVSLERACSGRALPELYRFLVADRHSSADGAVAATIAAAPDAAAAVAAAGLARSCPACSLALEVFVDMLAAAAGNLALQIVATGGIWLAGGIPPRILPALQGPRFAEAFRAKGRFRELMERIPVRVLTETRSALFGAATRALAS